MPTAEKTLEELAANKEGALGKVTNNKAVRSIYRKICCY
jgi:hypothetical protein